MPLDNGQTALYPQQVCFVVADVAAAVAECEQRFGWGPFFAFDAPVEDASYKNWRGRKLVSVALGMAGNVQVEFLHVHTGSDTTADYQAEYGVGFQHIGIQCKSRDSALAHLESLGATVNELNEYPGVRFGFVDVPTGPGMFEILETTAEMANNDGISGSSKADAEQAIAFPIDRASIVTPDIETALQFYTAAFEWEPPKVINSRLRIGASEMSAKRTIVRAGQLDIEMIEPGHDQQNPYYNHLQRGDHGLMHAGGPIMGEPPAGAAIVGEWLDSEEKFALYNWTGGANALQVRLSA